MFSQKAFIEASRQFVCCRIESYESKAAQDMVRSFLNGRFENTAFCILDPSGEERLSGTGRSPSQGLSERRGPGSSIDDADVIEKLNGIAKSYRPRGEASDAVLQDFHSFRQALNVASGDQRLLLFVAASGQALESAKRVLKPVMADPEIIGKFHVDLADAATDGEWAKAISEEKGASGLVIIRADPFGMEGTAVEHLPVTASGEVVKRALLAANEAFAKSEERKVYRDHVSVGREERIHFENGMPYGEDRDGDGVIDQRGGGGPRKGPK